MIPLEDDDEQVEPIIDNPKNKTNYLFEYCYGIMSLTTIICVALYKLTKK